MQTVARVIKVRFGAEGDARRWLATSQERPDKVSKKSTITQEAHDQMITEDVIAELDAFVPADETDNVGRIYEILDRLQQLPPESRAPVIPTILALIERHPEAELGSPGPLVHELESIPGYESFLRDSVLRQPACLNIWMVNRILNSEISPDSRMNWLEVLREVLKHPLASKESQQSAADFLKHQSQ